MNRKLNSLKWNVRRFIGKIICFLKGHKDDWGFSCKQPAVVQFCPRCFKVHKVKDLSK